MTNKVLADRLEIIEGLPTLPLVLRQIQKVMNNERTGMAQIAAVVAKDQALTSRAIRLVNSAWYGRTTRVTSIQQVLVTLGLGTLNTLMLGLTVTKMFNGPGTPDFDARAFWEHAFGTALLAKKLAGENGHVNDSEEYFVAGLLHDMGRLVFEQFYHEEFTEAIGMSRDNRLSLQSAEKQVFGFDHTETGAWLGGKWNIPRQLILAMEHHHRASLPPGLLPEEKEMIRIVAAANELCLAGGIGASGENAAQTGTSYSRIGWSPETCRRLIDQTLAEVALTIQQWSS